MALLPPATIAACASSRATIVQAAPAEYPQSARDAHAGKANVVIRVIVGPDGKVASENIATSSGRTDLDDAALRAARASTYSPERYACIALTAQYLFTVTLDPEASPAAPSPEASCSAETRDARIVWLAPYRYPDSARDLGFGAVFVLLTVDVASNGRASHVSIQRSSGNSSIDREAMLAATRSTYLPRLSNCVAQDGVVQLRIDFKP